MNRWVVVALAGVASACAARPVPVDLVPDLLRAQPWPQPSRWTPPAPPPADDAPADLLVEYWRKRPQRNPTAVVRARLLAACEAEPRLLTDLIWFLPDTDEATARLKSLLDRREPALDPNLSRFVAA